MSSSMPLTFSENLFKFMMMNCRIESLFLCYLFLVYLVGFPTPYFIEGCVILAKIGIPKRLLSHKLWLNIDLTMPRFCVRPIFRQALVVVLFYLHAL
jgi:hypothetical protein